MLKIQNILKFLKQFLKLCNWKSWTVWGSVTHQMAVPVPRISCCVLNHHNLFYQIQNALSFNQDTCCHLALCLQLLPFHWTENVTIGHKIWSWNQRVNKPLCANVILTFKHPNLFYQNNGDKEKMFCPIDTRYPDDKEGKFLKNKK